MRWILWGGLAAAMGMLLLARPCAAQGQTEVRLDINGTAAVEASMNGGKPENVQTRDGRRRAVFPVTGNGEGTVYAWKRGDGTTEVELINNGAQPSDPRAQKVGTFHGGDTVTFTPATMTATTSGPGGAPQGTPPRATPTAPTTPTAPATPPVNVPPSAPQQGVGMTGGDWRVSVGVRLAFGTGSLLDEVKETCESLRAEVGGTCSGSDRGPAGTFGFDIRHDINRQIDYGGRFDYARPSDVDINFDSSLQGMPLQGSGFAHGTLMNFAGYFGVKPTSRLRCHIGVGAVKFDYTTGSTISIGGQKYSTELQYTGIGRRLYGDIEYELRHGISIFGEAGRSWLHSDPPSGSTEEFDKRVSIWMIGIHFPILTFVGMHHR